MHEDRRGGWSDVSASTYFAFNSRIDNNGDDIARSHQKVASVQLLCIIKCRISVASSSSWWRVECGVCGEWASDGGVE